MCDHLAYCERNELKAENDRLRAELAAAHPLNARLARELSTLRAELAEARRALLAGNDTVLANKKLQEDNAAKDGIITNLNERSAQYERDVVTLSYTATEKATALEAANVRIAELEATRLHWTGEVARLTQNSCDDQDRAERAEAELKLLRGDIKIIDALHAELDAMRETVRKIRATDNITAVWHIADAALAPSPAGLDGRNLAVLYCLERAEAERDAMRDQLDQKVEDAAKAMWESEPIIYSWGPHERHHVNWEDAIKRNLAGVEIFRAFARAALATSPAGREG